jgi:integrase
MSARRVRITEATLKGLKPAPAGKRDYVWDAVLPGFGLMTMDTGASSYIVYKRFGGSRSPSRRKIGRVGRIGLAEARSLAREQLALAESGRDPKAEAREARRAAERRKTFGELVEVFLARHVRKQRKARDVEREIRNEILPVLGDRPIEEVSRKDVAELIGAIRDRPAPRHAHNILGHVRRFYSWLMAQPEFEDLIATNPCDRIRAKDLIGEKKSRQRVLDDAEIAAVWKASGKLADPWRSFYRLLLLTGARKSEVSDARQGEFDLDESKLWTIPSERFKSDRTHLVPLSADAIHVLEALPRGPRGDFVFSTRDGAIPIDGFSKSKAKLDALVTAELGRKPAPWQVHDLRRTVRTQLAKLRISSDVAELTIGHALRGLHVVYNQYDFLAERREALELWAKRLRELTTPPPENVADFDEVKRTRRARA